MATEKTDDDVSLFTAGFTPTDGVVFLLTGVSGKIWVELDSKEVLWFALYGEPSNERISRAAKHALDFVKACANVEGTVSINLMDKPKVDA
jgi:hypothetical protein